MLELLGAIFIFTIGLMVGSFLNVVILRLHSGRNFTKGRSACPDCGRVLSPLELVPVLSWVVQRGRCRGCGCHMSPQYPLVELMTAAVFVLAYLAGPPRTPVEIASLLLWLYVLSSLIVLAVYDLRWYRLPDRVLLPLILPALALATLSYGAGGSSMAILGPIVAAIIFGGTFFLMAFVSRGRWMGGGDIKLAFVMGLLLGLQKTALAMLLAFWMAALVGVTLIVLRQKKRQDHIPFGPFLIAGTMVAYLWGAEVIDWYLRSSNLIMLSP